ncbi:hypothetical protein EDD18DRAFT_1102651 [Armillaria luteobubalina]|uniref:Uncharacterized protein n=1 Tax=Armillaria luteobubalina TaxID=153913 RepID=A0AA39QAG0_9AGAR|nr:hypothetical protein EDD18DRAFT_1102651 [Armillaria luteobubalina]
MSHSIWMHRTSRMRSLNEHSLYLHNKKHLSLEVLSDPRFWGFLVGWGRRCAPFQYTPGNRKENWRPSWEQVMTNKANAPHFGGYPGGVNRRNNRGADFYMGYRIGGNVRGLSEVSNQPVPRQGEVVFNDANGATHTLKILADHMYPIPGGFYTLLGCNGMLSNPDRWVIGRTREDGRFEKLSVFRSADDEEARLYFLTFAKQARTFVF